MFQAEISQRQVRCRQNVRQNAGRVQAEAEICGAASAEAPFAVGTVNSGSAGRHPQPPSCSRGCGVRKQICRWT